MRFNSDLATAVGGRIGNMVGLMNKAGMCLRSWVRPSNPNTSAQQGVRATLRDLATAWSGTLSAANRAGWNAYAATLSFTSKLGTIYMISGFDAYVMCNGARIVAGLSRIDAPPAVGGFDSFTSVVPTFDVSSHNYSIAYTNTDEWANEVGGALVVRRVPVGFSEGIGYYEGPFIYLGKAVGAASPPTSPLVVDTGAGSIEADTQYAIAVRSVRADGRCSREAIFRGSSVA
jgi:hypothetical protein